ncbi:hypothetical protein ACN47E_006137 [Coniothyrium glycines]
MCQLLVLPAPLPSSEVSLGQLVTDPLHVEFASLKPSTAPSHKEKTFQAKYEDTVAHDQYGRFTSTRFVSKISGQPHYSHENLLMLAAEKMSFHAIDKPSSVFNTLRRDTTTRSFLCTMAAQKKPVYFVTGIQTLHKPSFKRAVVQHGVVAEASNSLFRPPVRRVDSASSIASTVDKDSQESVLAVELLKVKCRVGSRSEPHCIEDLDYNWSYHPMEGDLQLSIGLGKPLEASEMRSLGGFESEDLYEDGSNESWTSGDEDGIGGF